MCPELIVGYNAGGAGYEASLVIALASNEDTHITIYQSTWDDIGLEGGVGDAPLGPYGAHLTYTLDFGSKHVFFKIEQSGNEGFIYLLTDGVSARERLVINTFFNGMIPYL